MSTPGSAAERPCSLCGDGSAGAAARRLSIGPPFSQCWRCGGQIEKSGVHEWDMHSRAARWTIASRRIRFALAAGLVPALVYAGLALAGPRTLDPRTALLFLGAGWLAAGLWEGARLSMEISASRRRMSDPMYRAKLVQHGIAASRALLDGR